MTSSQSVLERECRVFTQYLLGCAPQPYVVQKYADAHRMSAAFLPNEQLDSLLVSLARTNRTVTQLVDSYARIFAPASTLRKKLVLLLAILETCPPSCELIDAIDGSRLGLLFRLVARGTIAVVSLLIGTAFLLPTQLVLSSVRHKAR
jgi:hypothetical protein